MANTASEPFLKTTQTLFLNQDFLLNYELRSSKRSRYLRMRISAQGILVTRPWGLNLQAVETWLLSKSAWIIKHWPLATIQQPTPLTLPKSIELKAIQQDIAVRYEFADLPRLGLDFDPAQQNIIIKGDIKQTTHCQTLLKTWLRQTAQLHLLSQLQDLALETGFKYERGVIKSQQTLWGSCSNKGIINLNAKLLLLPAAWVRYVLIHELCHTRELNHSPRFWTLVEQFEPDYPKIHHAMRNAMSSLPDWVK